MNEKTLTEMRRYTHVNRLLNAPSYTQNEKPMRYQETARDLQAKIEKITLMIKEQFPEKSKFIDAMPTAGIASMSADSDENIAQLRIYYDSLNAIHIKYKLENHFNTK